VDFPKFGTYSGKHLKAYEIGATRRDSSRKRETHIWNETQWKAPRRKSKRRQTQCKKRKERDKAKCAVRNVKDNCRPPCYFRQDTSLKACC